MIANLVKKTLRNFGYDAVPYPLPEWYLLRAALQEVFSSRQIDCVIDVGANHGQYGSFLRDIGYRGRIASFEPVSSSYEALSRRAAADSNWKVHHLALGSAPSELEINVSSQDQFSSFLPVNQFGNAQFTQEAAITRTERVQVARLDSMIEQIVAGIDNPRIYLKLDTQGFDLQVLEGAAGCIERVLGVQSEIGLKPIYEGMPDYLTSLSRLNALGFSIASLVPVSRDEKLRVIEFDCIMVRS